MTFRVEAVCISRKKGVQKHAVKEILLIENFGIKNDAHAGMEDRQVSLLSDESIKELEKEGFEFSPGAFGENLVIRGLDWTGVQRGGIITIGDVELEVTHIGKDCHTPCAIFRKAGRCIMPEMGIFTKVLRGGIIHAGDIGHYSL